MAIETAAAMKMNKTGMPKAKHRHVKIGLKQ
jgi:hypothetical protein